MSVRSVPGNAQVSAFNRFLHGLVRTTEALEISSGYGTFDWFTLPVCAASAYRNLEEQLGC
jgi:hypothetical protein